MLVPNLIKKLIIKIIKNIIRFSSKNRTKNLLQRKKMTGNKIMAVILQQIDLRIIVTILSSLVLIVMRLDISLQTAQKREELRVVWIQSKIKVLGLDASYVVM